MIARNLYGCAALVAFLAILLLIVPARASERCGEASWYGLESCTNPKCLTASGERFNPDAMTAAMPNRSEMGRSYRVRHRGRSVVVKITDLGPHRSLNRIIDLSRGAARKLGMERAGVGRVCITRIN